MDPFQGLKVELISGGRTLELYDDPEGNEMVGEGDPYQRINYVEAITGAKFVIQVTASSCFDISSLGPDDVVRFRFSLDGRSPASAMTLTREEIKGQTRAKGEATRELERIWEYCKVSDQWMSGNPVFSIMETEELNGKGVTPEQLRMLGSIQVRVERVRQVRLRTPRPFRAPKDEPITVVSEKMIKGKAITSIVKLQDASASKAQPVCDYEYFPLSGEAGKKLYFEIRYRSRQTLQSLGCIPRTPTPEPDLREENRTLRERLAQLERNSSSSNVKAEPSRITGSIKRERNNADDHRDHKRPRGLTSEVVDLTED